MRDWLTSCNTFWLSFNSYYEIKLYKLKGIQFCAYLYVPEEHPETNSIFYEREGEAHLIKVHTEYHWYNYLLHVIFIQRIASHTRSGGPSSVKLEQYTEALWDPTSGLTYPALIGSRKQSAIIDAEHLFSPKLSAFMKRKGYDVEANYIDTVCNWRRACDERGLSSLQRSKYNYNFLNMILDKLVPWHKQSYDFSLLEVNRLACA